MERTTHRHRMPATSRNMACQSTVGLPPSSSSWWLLLPTNSGVFTIIFASWNRLAKGNTKACSLDGLMFQGERSRSSKLCRSRKKKKRNIHNAHKECQKEYPQRISTKNAHKEYPQRISTKNADKCRQRMPTKNADKECPQRISTKNADKECPRHKNGAVPSFALVVGGTDQSFVHHQGRGVPVRHMR
jgi:hypothetical protein